METIIISLGGSLIVPDDVDVVFLRSFRELILSEVEKGKRFVIIAGGGKVCRKYQDAAKEVKEMSAKELDWLGIHSTRFNAEFIKILFKDLVEENIILDPTLPVKMDRPIVLGGGWKPGWSTDYDAVMLAKQLGAKKVVNLSNIDYAYDKDPRKFPDAKKLEKVSWQEYRAFIPKEWNPGLSTPFDPIASELAENEGIEVAIMNGNPIQNFANYLEGKEFPGTVIR
ncbi:MAG TPA: UMP kinase [Candidatus Paceibacterota bacterium]|nr:UMP kinase [Candidatus Paceibacterota bacterium]